MCVAHVGVFFTACSLFMLFLLIENNLVSLYGPPPPELQSPRATARSQEPRHFPPKGK